MYGHVAGAGGDLAGEARVLAALGHEHAVAAGDDRAGDADAGRQAHPDHLGRARAPGGLVDELAVLGVGQGDRAGRGLEHAGRGADDRLHDAPARGRAAEALGQRVAAIARERDADASANEDADWNPLLGQHLQAAGERGLQLGGRPGASLSSLSTSP